MRDEYYDDMGGISIDDLEDEWLDEDDGGEEPAPAPVREQRAGRREPERPIRSERRERKGRDQDADDRPNSRAERKPERGLNRRSDRRAASKDRKAEPAPARTAGTGTTSPLNDLLLLLFKIGLIAAFLIFMTTFFYGITQARDVSMEPAIKEGDLVIYYRPDKDYAVGDAIVVDYNGQLQVRRVVATAGDTVDISSDGGLIVNGSTQFEDDIYTSTYPYTDGITFPVTVGDGEVFVLGDDRTSAEDSRIYGTVKISATKGAVMTVIRRRGI